MLQKDLLLRTVRDETDIQKYVEFNTTYNNPNEGLNTGILLRFYPGGELREFLADRRGSNRSNRRHHLPDPLGNDL